MVHKLQSDDGRLFRCDVFGEIVQWEVTTDRSALEFVLGLHDMWSRLIAQASGNGPWWIGDSVKTVPEGHTAARRRLQEEAAVNVVDRVANDRIRTSKRDTATSSKSNSNIEKEKVTYSEEKEEDNESEDEHSVNLEPSIEGEETERGDFVLDAVAQKEVETNEDQRGDSSDEQEDSNLEVRSSRDESNGNENDSSMERDFSSYDTWMGILSSSSTKYFVRIVPSSKVGVVLI